MSINDAAQILGDYANMRFRQPEKEIGIRNGQLVYLSPENKSSAWKWIKTQEIDSSLTSICTYIEKNVLPEFDKATPEQQKKIFRGIHSLWQAKKESMEGTWSGAVSSWVAPVIGKGKVAELDRLKKLDLLVADKMRQLSSRPAMQIQQQPHEEEQKSSLPSPSAPPIFHIKSHEPTQEMLDSKMLAHVLGGFMVGEDDELEGSNHGLTMRYMQKVIHRFQEEDIGEEYRSFLPLNVLSQLETEFEQGIQYADAVHGLAKEAQNLSSKEKMASKEEKEKLKPNWVAWNNRVQALAKEQQKILHELKEGEVYLMSGGWSGAAGKTGHAMFYRWEKKAGKINLQIINTGAGAETHEYMLKGVKKKFNPVRQFEGLDLNEKEVGEDLIISFIQKNLLPFTTEEHEFSWEDIYGIDVERLKHKEKKLTLKQQDAITGQRSGVCAYKSVLIACRLQLGTERYKVFKHLLEIKTLQDGVANLTAGFYKKEAGGKKENKVINILERSAAKQMKATLKLRREKLITKAQAEEMYYYAQGCLEGISAYKKLPFKPYRTKVEKNTSIEEIGKSVKEVTRNNYSGLYIRRHNQQAEIGFERLPEKPTNLKEFVASFETYSKILSRNENSPNYPQLLRACLSSIGAVDPFSLWRGVSQDSEAREKMLANLRIITYSMSRYYSHKAKEPLLPGDIGGLLALFTATAFLSYHKADQNENSIFNQFGVNEAIFINAQKNWGCKEFFDANYSKNLNTLSELNKNKEKKLFTYPNYSYSGTQENADKEFEKWPDFMYLRQVLGVNPQIEQSWELRKEYRDNLADCHIGIGAREKELRMKALCLFSDHGYMQDIPQINDNDIYMNLRRTAYLCKYLLTNQEIQGSPDQYIYASLAKIDYQEKTSRLFVSFVGYPDREIPDENIMLEGLAKNHLDKVDGVSQGSKDKPKYILNPRLFDPKVQHQPQNKHLVNYELAISKSKAFQNERDLNIATSEPTLQVDHLIAHFDSNPDLWEHLPSLTYLQSHLLEGDILKKQMEAEPKLVLKLVSFLKTQWKTASHRPDALDVEGLAIQMFLAQLNQHLLNYVASHHPNVDMSPLRDHHADILQNLKLISQKIDQPWLKSFVSFTQLFCEQEFIKGLGNTESDWKKIEELIQLQEEATENFEKVKAEGGNQCEQCNNYLSPQLVANGSQTTLMLTPIIREFLDKDAQKIRPLINKLMAKRSFPQSDEPIINGEEWKLKQLIDAPKIILERWIESFPYYIYQDTEGEKANRYTINLLNGKVTCNGESNSILPAWCLKNEMFQNFFQSAQCPIELQPLASNAFQGVYKNTPIKLVYADIKKNEDKSASSKKAEADQKLEILVEYKSPDNPSVQDYKILSPNAAGALKIPDALKNDTLIGVTTTYRPSFYEENHADDQHTDIIVLDRKTLKVIAELNSKGQIKHTNISTSEKSYLIESTDSLDMREISSFARKYALAWSNKPQPDASVQNLEFRGMEDDHHRVLSFNKVGDKLHWTEDQDFYISKNQSLNTLRGYENYLLLENAKGERLVVLPRTDQEKFYSIIPVTKKGVLLPNSTLQNLQVASIYFRQGDFAKAHHYLEQAHSAKNYSDTELGLLQEIIKLKSDDPWACVVRIFAAQQALDNIRLIPPSLGRIIDPFWKNKIDKIVTHDLSTFIVNRNLPESYFLDKLLGTDRLLRLLKDLNAQDPIIKEYYLEITTSKYSLAQGLTYQGISPSFPASKVPQISHEVMWECLMGETAGLPDYYLRPGEEFQRKFRQNYADATSDNRDKRNQLKQRLQNVLRGNNPENKWLAHLLLDVIAKRENSIYSYTMPTVDNLLHRENLLVKQAEENYKRENAKLMSFQIPKEFDRKGAIKDARKNITIEFFHKLGAAYSIPELQINYPRVPNAQGPEIALQYKTSDSLPSRGKNPEFTNVSGQYSAGTILPEDIQQGVMARKKVMDNQKPVGLCADEEINQLQQKLKLSPYVASELKRLNTAVKENPEEPAIQYSLDIHQLPSMESKLQENIRNDQKEADRLKEKILALANKNFGKDEHDLDLALLRGSTKQLPWTIESCLAAFLHNRWDLFEQKEPKLTPSEIDGLHQELVKYLVVSIRRQQSKRAFGLTKRLQNELKTNPAGTKLSAALEHELGSVLTSERTYDVNNNPAMLLFEYATRWTIKPSQALMLSNLFSKDEKGTHKNIIIQLIMGGGKSKTISPIQALMKADGEHLSAWIVPDSLFETNLDDGEKTSRELFGQKLKAINFTREDATVPYLETILYTMQEAVSHRDYIIMRPKDSLCLKLKHDEARAHVENLKGKEDPEQWRQKAKLLREILIINKKIGRCTTDEADTVRHCKYQVNFTLGTPTPPSIESRETIVDIYRFLQMDPQLRSLVRLRDNKQNLLSAEDWKVVKAKLVSLMLDKTVANFPLNISREELISYCSGNKDPLAQTAFAKLCELYKKRDPNLRSMISRITTIKLSAEKLLEETLKKNTNTHYGLSKEHPELGFAIPYRANNTPNESAQFANPEETLNKTMQIYATEWKEPEQTKQLVTYLRDKISQLNQLGFTEQVNEISEYFKEMAGMDLYRVSPTDTSMIKKITDEINNRIKQKEAHPETINLVSDYLLNVVFANQIKVFPGQLNANTQDLDAMFLESDGYTGTPGSKHVFPPRIHTIESAETDRETIRALQDGTSVHAIVSEDVKQLFSEIYKKHGDDAHAYRAFIDIGALFKGKDNGEVASEMLSFFKENQLDKQGLVFWNTKTNSLMLKYQDAQGVIHDILLPSSNQDVTEAICKKLKIDVTKLFTYYDHRHVVGADRYFEDGSKAFATVSSQTTKDKLLQGSMRMRGLIARTHQVEFLIQNEEYAQINKNLQKPPDHVLSIDEIVLHTEIVQAQVELQENYDATRQMLQTHCKEFFLQKILDAPSEEEAQRLFSMGKPLFLNQRAEDAFLDYGAIQDEEESSEVALKRYATNLVEMLKGIEPEKPQAPKSERFSIWGMFSKLDKKTEGELEILNKELFSIINDKVASGCLPQTVPRRPEVDVESHLERESVSEEQSDKEKELENQRENERQLERQGFSPPSNRTPAVEKPWTDDVYSVYIGKYADSIMSKLASPELPYDTFDYHIYISHNFLKTIMSEDVSLFSALQKGIADILVIDDNYKMKVCILSRTEAAQHKARIVAEKHAYRRQHQQLWLTLPNKDLIQEGPVPWPPREPKKEEELDTLFTQLLFLSANVTYMNRSIDKLRRWIEPMPKERKKALKDLLYKLMARSPKDQKKFENSPNLKALFET